MRTDVAAAMVEAGEEWEKLNQSEAMGLPLGFSARICDVRD